MDIPRIPRPTKVTPGLGQMLLIAEIDWLDELAEPQALTGTSAYGDDSRIVADHEFLAGKGFRDIYISNRDSELLADYLGSQDSRAVMPRIEAFMPGINPVTTTFFSEIKGYILLVPDAKCDGQRYVQIGTKCRPAEIPAESVRMRGGKAESNDPSGHEVVINGYADRVLFYEGVVTMYPAPVEPEG